MMLKVLTFLTLFFFHPVHVTLTSIDQVTGTDSLKVFVRMYYDDFLRDYKLFDTSDESAKFSVDKQFPAELMNIYLNEKVNILINNKLLKGKLLNMTLADNEISMNLLFRSVKKPRVICVRNKIMTGLYTDQANMTMIKINDFEEGVRLTTEEAEKTYSLK